jgi:hypothetical protein
LVTKKPSIKELHYQSFIRVLRGLLLCVSEAVTLPYTIGRKQNSFIETCLSIISFQTPLPSAFVFVSLIAIISLLGVKAASAEDLNGLTYSLNSPISGEATLTGRVAASEITDINIPDEVVFKNVVHSVTRISDNGFESNNLTNVDFSDNIASIGNSAFKGINLTRVIISFMVSSIGVRFYVVPCRHKH